MPSWNRQSPALLAVLALALTGCVTDEPGYEAIPDATLYSEIGELPGVKKVNIAYAGDSLASPYYEGAIVVGKRADMLDTLDNALAILRQGQLGAGMRVTVRSPGRANVAATRTIGWLPDDLQRRYGPQPGDGVPPDKKPVLLSERAP